MNAINPGLNLRRGLVVALLSWLLLDRRRSPEPAHHHH